MKYIVYLTTNLKNNKVYVGVHKTETPHMFDGYIGDGVYVPKKPENFKIKVPNTPFKNAINKYDIKNFVRSIISIFDNENEAYELEEKIVTQSFVNSKHTYNVKLGGLHSTSTTALKINQYTVDGKYLKTWESMVLAANSFGVVPSVILESCTEKSITAAGYVWRYYNGDINDVIVRSRVPSNKGDVNSKPVVQYSKQGYKKKTFKSIAEASRQLNISYRSIEQCCNLDMNNKSAGGYQWRLESDNLDFITPLNSVTAIKEVEQLINGIVINTYKGSNQAAKELGFPKLGRNIRKACTVNITCKGYFWRYKG